MFSWFSRRASSAGGNGVRGRGDGGCGGNDGSSAADGGGADQAVSTAGKENSMGPVDTSGSRVELGSSTTGVPTDASGGGGISTICGCSTGGGRGSDSSAVSTHPAIFS
jgi:hypothetical protein